MRSEQDQLETIFIVDPHPDDYRQLLQESCPRAKIVFLHSAEEALRCETSTPGPWLINSRLPDMRGVELCRLLKPRLSRSPLTLIADQYNAEDELAALCAGSLHFVAKPLSSDWLSQLLSTSFPQTLSKSPVAAMSASVTPTSTNPPSMR